MADDTGREALIDVLRRFNISSDRFVEIFAAAHGLHRTDMNALAYVSAAEATEPPAPLSPGQLGTELNLSSPATSALLDRLERVGHVRRERDTADRRRVVLRTEDQGMQVARDYFIPLGRALHAVMDDFEPAELAVVQRFLERVVDAVETTRRAARP